MGEGSSTHVADERDKKNSVQELQGEDATQETGLVARNVRKWTVQVSGVRVWSGFIWLRTSNLRFVVNSAMNLGMAESLTRFVVGTFLGS